MGTYPSQLDTRDVCNRFFISVWFRFSFLQKKLVRFRMSLVQFGLKMRFGLDVTVIYYVCNGCVVNLQQILQHYWHVE